VRAVVQASQWSPSIFKVLGVLGLNMGAPGLGCRGEGQCVDLSMSPLTCVTVIFTAEGSCLQGAASQAKHGQVCDSGESCMCGETGVKISYKISCLQHICVVGRPFRLAGCYQTARGCVGCCLRFKKKCAMCESSACKL